MQARSHGTAGRNKEEQRGQKMMRRRRCPLLQLGVVLLLAAATLSPASSAANEANMNEPVIVAFGDSLTSGLGLAESEAFPAKLEKALRARGRKVKVVNAGVSGDTAAAGLARVDWSIPDDASAVIVELGANDALEGLPPSATKASLEEILTRIQAKGLPILLAGMEAPRNMGKEYADAFGAIYPDLAKRHGILLYPFFLDGVALDETLTFSDGMHPNARGVERIVEGILPKVEELLSEAGDNKG
jgi:acyl-CoA thioesterase-1